MYLFRNYFTLAQQVIVALGNLMTHVDLRFFDWIDTTLIPKDPYLLNVLR